MEIIPTEKREKMHSSKLFQKTNAIWNNHNYNQRRYIGCVTDEIKKFIKTKNIEELKEVTKDDFMNYYFENVKSQEELEEIAIKFKNAIFQDIGLHISEIVAFAFVLMRVIDDTFIGIKRELAIIEELQKKYPDCKIEITDEILDCDYAIDLIRIKNGKIIEGIQVKPESFISVRFKNYIKIACYQNYEKHKKFMAKYKPEMITYYTTDNNLNNIKTYDYTYVS